MFRPNTEVYSTCSGTSAPRCVLYNHCEEKQSWTRRVKTLNLKWGARLPSPHCTTSCHDPGDDETGGPTRGTPRPITGPGVQRPTKPQCNQSQETRLKGPNSGSWAFGSRRTTSRRGPGPEP